MKDIKKFKNSYKLSTYLNIFNNNNIVFFCLLPSDYTLNQLKQDGFLYNFNFKKINNKVILNSPLFSKGLKSFLSNNLILIYKNDSLYSLDSKYLTFLNTDLMVLGYFLNQKLYFVQKYNNLQKYKDLISAFSSLNVLLLSTSIGFLFSILNQILKIQK